MGVTGGLVRGIFFRNKSFGADDYNNGRSNLGEKKRWSSVRSYFCGDEFNSVLAVDDSGSIKDPDSLLTLSQQLSSDFIQPLDSILATQGSASVKRLEEEDSVKSSEATVTQPLRNQSQVTETYTPKKNQTNSVLEEDAAVIIQSAFRSYLAIRRSKEVEAAFAKEDSVSGGEGSPGKTSIGTSVQVQTDHSAKASVFWRKQVSANRTTLPKSTTQVPHIKEDWDDSTVSSTISKLRVQSRIEAMTKRERALAYAFSQQLRICSKKKQTDHSSKAESNIGWSWLERWMATRVPDSNFTEPRTNIQTDVATKNQRLVVKNRSFGIGGELESCASNDLPLQFESISEKREEVTEDLHTENSSVKASISKRKSGPSYTRHNKVQTAKRDMQQQTKKAKKAKWEMNARKLNER